MALELPSSLSPSKVSSFTDCALSFRFSAIDRIPSPPTVATVKGTLVHSALEALFARPAAERTVDAAIDCLATARTEIVDDPEWIELALDAEAREVFDRDADRLVRLYFELEDPTTIEPLGLELHVEHTLAFDDGTSVLLRGIIDRVERDRDGQLVISDYKTGRAPREGYQQSRLGGVNFYSYVYERLEGERPARVQLLYLGTPAVVAATPTEQSTRSLENRLRSIWSAIETACERDAFRPKKSRLCDWCSYQQWCPDFGGDPDRARPEFEASGRAYAPPAPAAGG